MRSELLRFGCEFSVCNVGCHQQHVAQRRQRFTFCIVDGGEHSRTGGRILVDMRVQDVLPRSPTRRSGTPGGKYEWRLRHAAWRGRRYLEDIGAEEEVLCRLLRLPGSELLSLPHLKENVIELVPFTGEYRQAASM